MTIKDRQIEAWIAAGGPQTPMRAKAHELLTGVLADHGGGLEEHEILAGALQDAFEEGQRAALDEKLTPPADVNESTPLEYELRGPEALLVIANSGTVLDWRPELLIMASRWAQAIRDRAAMRTALEAAESLVARCAALRVVDADVLGLLRVALGKNGKVG
jgi:hypothetical protein